MLVRITKTFTSALSNRALVRNELLDVDDAIGQKWVDSGNAQVWKLTPVPVPEKAAKEFATAPARTKREKAIRS
jgi:hypothetical protein